jgi:hypothetical protein
VSQLILFWLTVTEHRCHNWLWIYSTCGKDFPVLSSFIAHHRVVTKVTRRVPLVEQELISLPEHLSLHPAFSGVRLTRSIFGFMCNVLWIIVCPFLIWPLCCLCVLWLGFAFPLWHLQTLHKGQHDNGRHNTMQKTKIIEQLQPL